MHLYYHPLSSNARRVTMAADHLGIKLDLVEINLASEGDRRRLKEVSDFGKIPVLIDDGFVLTESCAIMQYLADSKPGQKIYPHDPLARADVNRWMFWASQHFATAISIFAWENVWNKFVNGADANPAELARGTRFLSAAAEVLDKHVANRQWLVGETATLADYAAAAPLMYLERARLPLEQYTNLLAWFGRVQELPAWRHTTPVW